MIKIPVAWGVIKVKANIDGAIYCVQKLNQTVTALIPYKSPRHPLSFPPPPISNSASRPPESLIGVELCLHCLFLFPAKPFIGDKLDRSSPALALLRPRLLIVLGSKGCRRFLLIFPAIARLSPPQPSQASGNTGASHSSSTEPLPPSSMSPVTHAGETIRRNQRILLTVAAALPAAKESVTPS